MNNSRRGFLSGTTFAAACAVVAFPCHATDDLAVAVRRAEELLDRTLAAQAFDLLVPLERHCRRAEPTLALRFWKALGTSLRDTGRPRAALAVFECLRRYAAEIGDHSLYVKATIETVICLMNDGDWRSARNRLYRERNTLEETSDPAFRVETVFWIARTLESSGDLASALELGREFVVPASRLYEGRSLQIARHTFVCRLALEQPSVDWQLVARSLDSASTLLGAHTPVLRRGQFHTASAHCSFRRGDLAATVSSLQQADRAFEAGGIVSPHRRELQKVMTRDCPNLYR
ncbi:hypothetical protein IU479_08365 [Nocardia abscessus]|uniref:hypothetical protein n=1 Tax=Nocardia TaxID=1817 RepID=UPI00189355B4|nr:MULTISPECIES: hypothetical protein [Nocardia]MBF6218124.1 hypothetical protein [Nocardia abscessus]MDE1670507.1 hypothetical protein [Nocardia gipuzkoensis]